jgi:hypothetical protein
MSFTSKLSDDEYNTMKENVKEGILRYLNNFYGNFTEFMFDIKNNTKNILKIDNDDEDFKKLLGLLYIVKNSLNLLQSEINIIFSDDFFEKIQLKGVQNDPSKYIDEVILNLNELKKNLNEINNFELKTRTYNTIQIKNYLNYFNYSNSYNNFINNYIDMIINKINEFRDFFNEKIYVPSYSNTVENPIEEYKQPSEEEKLPEKQQLCNKSIDDLKHFSDIKNERNYTCSKYFTFDRSKVRSVIGDSVCKNIEEAREGIKINCAPQIKKGIISGKAGWYFGGKTKTYKKNRKNNIISKKLNKKIKKKDIRSKSKSKSKKSKLKSIKRKPINK